MSPLFAHHVEPQHLPVLLAFFTIGCWLGWHLLGRWVSRADGTSDTGAQS